LEFDGDPHTTLGLPRGASRAEIKAAYRRLAKAFHPDTAGEAAIPRFLAIQAAYETLIGTAPGRPARSTPPTDGWRADPARAQATREAWRARGRRGSATGAAGGVNGAGGADRAGDRTGARGGSRRTRPTEGTANGPAGGDDPGRPGGGRRAPRDRAPDTATPGSTTYDFAEQDPYDPEWSGASWYGTTSGTYWTINPKEYADPRKHGPEYQARARRRGAAAPEIESQPAEANTSDAPPERAAAPSAAARERPPAPPPWSRLAHEPDAEASAILPIGGGPTTRIGLALLGWPPLGFAVAALIGEATGCSRFAAACIDPIGLGTWVAQILVIAVLFALPRLAAVSAYGTLAVLAASIPATMLLSPSGGPQERAAATAALVVVLAAAYLAGAVFAIARRSRTLRA
jgi:Meckel syndrome type 1 protein